MLNKLIFLYATDPTGAAQWGVKLTTSQSKKLKPCNTLNFVFVGNIFYAFLAILRDNKFVSTKHAENLNNLEIYEPNS